MFGQQSVSALLKSAVAVMALAAMVSLASHAWNAGNRLSAATKVADVADASAHLFTAMHNLRTDRATTLRSVNDGKPAEAEVLKRLEGLRQALLPALQRAGALIQGVEFADAATLRPALARGTEKLAALQAESWQAIQRPKAERREALAKDYAGEASALLELLDKLSGRLAASIRGTDSFIDQMMTMKHLAWQVRNAGGEASLLVSNGIAAGKLAPEALPKYAASVGGSATAWAALEDLTAGTALPAGFQKAIAGAKATYFDAEYTAMRDRMLQALLNGQKIEMTANQWAPFTVGKLASLIAVADGALAAAKERADALIAEGTWAMGLSLGFLVAAIVLAVACMTMVGRRVVAPLVAITAAMRRLADGDLSADAPYADRKDEIGALAGALLTFRGNATEKAAIEAEQAERRTRTEARQKVVAEAIVAFERQIGDALRALGTASSEMGETSVGMTSTAEQTNQMVRRAADASNAASSNVDSVAAAAEELGASIGEIGRQVSHATEIAARAVEETRRTDGTVQGLAEAASRIGEVVQLINDIAAQTNLLALNATIEAARAGEAGKGFAVVASEVKSLANQTAKATEDISSQISSIQAVTMDAVNAIKRIGGIIDEVSKVATTIAAAVDQQGAATQEISRNTQETARRTREVTENIAGVTGGADATGAAASAVRSSAEILGRQAGELRGQVDSFLVRMREAA